MWIGGISGVCTRRVAGARVGHLLLVMGLATLLTACLPRGERGVVAPRTDLSLDLPPEPSTSLRHQTPIPVQTVPPPLGTLGAPTSQPPVATGRPAVDHGIPARPGGSYAGAPVAPGGQVKAPGYSGQQAKKAVQKKAVAKKKKPKKKQNKSAVRRNTAAGTASACPCTPPQVRKKPSAKTGAVPAGRAPARPASE